MPEKLLFLGQNYSQLEISQNTVFKKEIYHLEVVLLIEDA